MIAALLYRPAEISERALSRGFAIAAAGHDVPAPHLLVAALPGVPGWAVAFYASGTRLPEALRDDEFDHACELFEDDDLPPAVAVLDAAAEEGTADEATVVYAITYADDHVHDDAWRFGGVEGPARRFVCEGETSLEAGAQSPDASEDIDLAGEAEAGPHRGSTFLSTELGAPVLPAIMGALYAADHRVDARLCDPAPDAIAAVTARVDRVLGREAGRGAFAPAASVAGVAPPAPYTAFATTYAFVDPTDPQDLYRELALGAIEGTLRFLREADLAAKDRDPAWAAPALAGLFPIADLRTSGLGSSAQPRGTIALGPDGATLVLVSPAGATRPAGATFAELLRYLELGWKRRSDVEEDEIGALMLRAHLRSRRATTR